MTGAPSDPGDMSPREARDRLLARRETDATDRTLASYKNRLSRWVEWCEENQIERVGDLTAWHIDEYDMSLRTQDYAPATIKGHLTTLRVLVKYLARIDAVDEGMPDAVDVPNLSPAEESSDERLNAEDAYAALEYFRNNAAVYGRPMHAFLEVAWNTGARVGGIRALDVGDYSSDSGTLAFRHRPSTDTPLKNKEEGERIVGIPPTVCDVVDVYIARERSNKRDDYGREPLFSARQGRPSFSTYRAWSYLATQPCLHSKCPHGRQRQSCEYVNRTDASKCPSSRSPHRIRTGSITEQLNRGYDIDKVSARVNATPQVLRDHYDVAGHDEEFEQRRRAEFADFDITNQTND
ncbi:tyrosine-type recombinase/integrase [Haloarchaeobius sp. TZWSO28]|uniref:tyrosine-type recombinase/integrase n=1 Tax=Haloarchaeobius sp. TZWSO28 TaxID=3446119 RepID=UPI003EBD984D